MPPTADDTHFPNAGLRVVSALVHFFGTAILASSLTRRVALEDLNTLRGWRTLSIARLTIILIFADSLSFLLLTGILVHGIGLELSNTSCSLGVLSCIALYSSSKVLIYIFLCERVWIVWSNMGGPKSEAFAAIGMMDTKPSAPSIISTRLSTMGQRLKSPVYRICVFSVVGYATCFVLLLVYRIARRTGTDGSCVIGLARQASIPLLSYDVYLTCFLTGLFVWPLWSNRVMSHRLRRLAIRTLMASFVALATSTVNIAVLTTLQGHELGWLCLASCGTDVMINALVLDFVTESRLKRHIRHSHTRVRAAQGGELSSSANPSSGAGPGQQLHLGGGKAAAVYMSSGTTHSVELPAERNFDSAASLSPVTGETKSGEIMTLPSPSPSPGSDINEVPDSVEVRSGSTLSQNEPSEPGHDTPTGTVYPTASALPAAPHSPTQLHRLPSGKTLTIHVDHSKGRDRPHCEDDDEHDDNEGQSCQCDHSNYGSEGSSEGNMSDDGESLKMRQRSRLLSFTEVLQELGTLRPPQPSPRVRTTFRETVKAPRRLPWTPHWRQHQQQQLPYLKPMQGPPGAGYIGTSTRRMSMPLTPDDIVLEDFYASTPASPSSLASGSNHPVGGLFANRRPSQDYSQALPRVPSSAFSFPPWASKGKGVALENLSESTEPNVAPRSGAMSECPEGGSSSPMFEGSSRAQVLEGRETEETR